MAGTVCAWCGNDVGSRPDDCVYCIGYFEGAEAMAAKLGVAMSAVPNEGTQAEHLERVSKRIARNVIQFVEDVGDYNTFHMDDLRKHIQRHVGGAPDSPSRILRDLRLRGVIDYRVEDRRASLYRVLPTLVVAEFSDG